MLDYADQPYTYHPPKRSLVMVWFAKLYNRKVFLPGKELIDAVEVSGLDGLRAAIAKGDRLLILPNHPTHADPAIVFEALRQAGLTSKFMVAYDVLLRSRVRAALMRYLGGFSVDREGSDPAAAKEAMATLREGRHALTIFPEGNVYLQNDTVGPFHDGAAFLGIKAAQESADGRVLAVPVSIKVTHLADVRDQRVALLRKMAADVDAKPPADAPPRQLLRDVGLTALRRNLKLRGLPLPDASTLPELIRAAAGEVLSKLESKMGLPGRPDDSPFDRIRRARREIHRVRTDPSREADHKTAAAWADEAMVAFKIASYSGQYVESKPTLDRFAETVEKLEEDVYSRMPAPYSPRRAFVRFAPPIDLTPLSKEPKLRVAVQGATEAFEKAVQQGLDALNAANPHPGGRPL